MKILVCIKQVPDMESPFRIDEQNTWYRETGLAWRMNEYDEYAVEQAVQLKEQVGEADITVLSIGPERVKEALKKALALGCDRAVQVQDDVYYHKDPYAIAAMIYEFGRDKGFDLIFTGMQSQDRGSGQTGVLLAEMLGLPALTTIVYFAYQEGLITVKRELEGGTKAVVRAKAPALVTCQLGLNKPRYPTLPNIMKAKKKQLVTIPGEALLRVEPRLATERIYFPEKRGGGMILEGDVSEQADQLITILQEKTGLLARR